MTSEQDVMFHTYTSSYSELRTKPVTDRQPSMSFLCHPQKDGWRTLRWPTRLEPIKITEGSSTHHESPVRLTGGGDVLGRLTPFLTHHPVYTGLDPPVRDYRHNGWLTQLSSLDGGRTGSFIVFETTLPYTSLLIPYLWWRAPKVSDGFSRVQVSNRVSFGSVREGRWNIRPDTSNDIDSKWLRQETKSFLY